MLLEICLSLSHYFDEHDTLFLSSFGLKLSFRSKVTLQPPYKGCHIYETSDLEKRVK